MWWDLFRIQKVRRSANLKNGTVNLTCKRSTAFLWLFYREDHFISISNTSETLSVLKSLVLVGAKYYSITYFVFIPQVLTLVFLDSCPFPVSSKVPRAPTWTHGLLAPQAKQEAPGPGAHVAQGWSQPSGPPRWLFRLQGWHDPHA